MIGPERAALLAALIAALLAAGCMPWTVGETAETVPPGRFRPAAGLALLAPPSALDRPFPVPQVAMAVGAAERLDVAATWVPPLTFHARVKLRLPDPVVGAGVATAATLGMGVHGIPDVAAAGTRFWTPFLTAGLLASPTRPAPRPYAALRVLAPFHPEDGTATLWLVAQAGLELPWRGVRWGPEAGVVVPSLHPDRAQLLLAVSARPRVLP